MARARKPKPYRFASAKTWFNGYRDGNKELPPADDADLTHFERELIDRAESQIYYATEKWSRADERFKSRYCQAKKELVGATTELNGFKSKGKNIEQFEQAYNSAEENLKQREHVTPMPIYLTVIGILALCEVPVNRIVFEVFGENKLLTSLYALVVGMIIVGVAHHVGKRIKEENLHPLFYVSIGAVFLCLAALAYIRLTYFEETAKFLGIQVNPLAAMLLFFTLNVLFFVFGTWASKDAHPKNLEEYHRLTKTFKTTDKGLVGAEKDYMAIKDTIKRLNSRIDILMIAREKTHEQALSEIGQICNAALLQIRKYRKTNLKYRTDKTVASFKVEPKFTIPEQIKCLDWECDRTKLYLQEHLKYGDHESDTGNGDSPAKTMPLAG